MKVEFKDHLLVYLLLGVVLAVGFGLRVYRVGQVLGFYFDQGRDALVIWRLWHEGKFFLIGPTTGIAGIFRGPFYYYLIAPFYLLGGGDPVWPAVMLAGLSVAAIGLMYYLGVRIQDRVTGLLAAGLASFSFYMVMAGRWLSNPTPMLLLSMVLVLAMIWVTEGKKWAWTVIAGVSGASLFHFGSSGEFYYFFALGVFGVWQRKNWPGWREIGWAGVVFGVTAVPLVLFDLRHGGILRQNVMKFMFKEESFKLAFWEVARTRLNFYLDVIMNKIFLFKTPRSWALMAGLGLGLLYYLPKFWSNKGAKILLLLTAAPLVGLLFFQGNFGNIYDYYLTGYYQIFLLVAALVLGRVWRSLPGKVFVVAFFGVFLSQNLEVTRFKISDGVDGPESVALKNEKQGVEWVYEDAGDSGFNVDVYVPPVIPYAYDYLFVWMGTTKYNRVPEEAQVGLLYTLYEVDGPHPERLDAWKERQAGIGEIEEEVRFGGITVQRRRRIADGNN